MRKLYSLTLTIFLSLGFLVGITAPANAFFGFSISVGYAPPPLPIYYQPPCPGYGYIWVPGYWAWDDDDDDYYWVPGTWVLPPRIGFYWTPAYWAYDDDGDYVFYPGYWGPSVGFYGGIDYGFGYTGYGYEGGYWRGNAFYYNRAVNNVSITNIRTVYNQTVINNTTINNISYNGGPGGVRARPTPQQLAVAREEHFDPTPMQRQHVELARNTRILRADYNHGAPPVAATVRPTMLQGPQVVPAVRAGGNFAERPRNQGPNNYMDRQQQQRAGSFIPDAGSSRFWHRSGARDDGPYDRRSANFLPSDHGNTAQTQHDRYGNQGPFNWRPDYRQSQDVQPPRHDSYMSQPPAYGNRGPDANGPDRYSRGPMNFRTPEQGDTTQAPHDRHSVQDTFNQRPDYRRSEDIQPPRHDSYMSPPSGYGNRGPIANGFYQSREQFREPPTNMRASEVRGPSYPRPQPPERDRRGNNRDHGDNQPR